MALWQIKEPLKKLNIAYNLILLFSFMVPFQFTVQLLGGESRFGGKGIAV